MTRNERELAGLQSEFKSIPRQITETKRRGRAVHSGQNKVRKAQARFERARRICLSLPKPWQSYQAHGKGRNLYARPEVQEINDANKRLYNEKDYLRHSVDRYEKRHTDRAELRKRLRELPDEIQSMQQIVEIQARRKKPAKESDWKTRWEEVAPGQVVKKSWVREYLKTLDIEPIKNIIGGFCVFSHGSGYIKFPLKTWGEAKYCRA